MVKEDAISPPTFIDNLTMKNHTLLDKSNSTINRMNHSDKIEYAKVKLDQLSEIKDLYLTNGGSNQEFRNNVDKMIQFYQKLLQK